MTRATRTAGCRHNLFEFPRIARSMLTEERKLSNNHVAASELILQLSITFYEEPTIAKKQQNRINDQIRITPIRVIDHDGTQLGVISTADALKKAQDQGLDLVEVAPEAKPPVCRIMDFGKFKYDKSKRTSKNKAHQTKLKEIRVRPKTGEHDIDFKVKKAVGFLKHNDKVQVTVLFRGREMAHIEEGRKVMEGIIEKLSEFGKVENRPSQQSRKMICTISPLKT